ncbi:hypothetical protein Hanom_Chr01g00035691 [Helianthus anomalus]
MILQCFLLFFLAIQPSLLNSINNLCNPIVSSSMARPFLAIPPIKKSSLKSRTSVLVAMKKLIRPNSHPRC